MNVHHKEFNPDEPRDEDGKWTDGGGDGGGGGGSDSGSGGGGTSDALKPELKINAGKVASGAAKTRAINQVTEAVRAVPAAHIEQIKHVPIDLVNNYKDMRKSEASNTAGLFSWGGGPPSITIPIRQLYSYKNSKDEVVTADLPMKGIQRSVVHEIGHAVDHSNGWGHGNKFDLGAMRAKMTKKEAINGSYYVNDKKEAFAELYALAHNPNHGSTKYFGGMSRKRAESVFATELEQVKKL